MKVPTKKELYNKISQLEVQVEILTVDKEKIEKQEDVIEDQKDENICLQMDNDTLEKLVTSFEEALDDKNLNLFPCRNCKDAYSINPSPGMCNVPCAFRDIYDALHKHWHNS